MKRTRLSKPAILALALFFLLLGALETHAAMSCADLFDSKVTVEMVIPHYNVPVPKGTRTRAAKSTLLIRGLVQQIEKAALSLNQLSTDKAKQKAKAISDIVDQTMSRVIENGAVELDGVHLLIDAIRPQVVFAVAEDRRLPYSTLVNHIGQLARAGDAQMRKVIDNGLNRHAIVSPAVPGDRLNTPEARAKLAYLMNTTDAMDGSDQLSWTF